MHFKYIPELAEMLTPPDTMIDGFRARVSELEAERDALRLKLRVAENALQRTLRIMEVSFEDCCADSGTIIPEKAEFLASEAKKRIQRRPDPAKGAPRPAGHNPVA